MLSAITEEKLEEIKSRLYMMEIEYAKTNIDTDIPYLSIHHKELLYLIREIFILLGASNAKEERLKSVLYELISYSVIHFSYEEKLMKDAKYPDFLEHKLKHDDFNNKLDDFLKELDGRVNLHDYMLRLSDWLEECFFDDVLNDDRKMLLFMKKRIHRKIYYAIPILMIIICIILIFIC